VRVPPLAALRLHCGTVWRWNRAVYDPAAGGHLRIEMRALPSGPTLADMLANAAFLLGLTLGLAPDVDRLVTGLTFGQARANFYCAARFGLDAELLWPRPDAPSPQPEPASVLVPRLLPLARRGLVDAGVDAVEVERLLAVVAARVAAGTTGARWQRRMLAALEPGRGRAEALAAMFARYRAHAESEAPVHTWPGRGPNGP
jgi:hypothetical protein